MLKNTPDRQLVNEAPAHAKKKKGRLHCRGMAVNLALNLQCEATLRARWAAHRGHTAL